MMVLLTEIREVRQRKCFSHLSIYKTNATTVVLLTENRRDWWGNRKNKQTLSVWKTLHGIRLWAMFDSCFSFPGHCFSISTSKEALYKGKVLSRVSIKLSIFPTKSSNIKNCSSEREQPRRRRKRGNLKTISRIERAAHFLADFFAVRVWHCCGPLKVARYSFSGSILPKSEDKIHHYKQGFRKIATTIVLDKDENLLWSGLQWHRSWHRGNEMTPLPILLTAVFLGTGNCSSKIFHGSFSLQ